MKFIKSLCIVLLLIGVSVQGMSKAKEDLKKVQAQVSLSDMKKVLQYAYENQNAIWAGMGKILIPYASFNLLEKDYSWSKKIKDFVFQDKEEYRNIKWGTHLIVGAWAFKPQILNAGMSEKFLNNVLRILAISLGLGKAISFVNNYYFNKDIMKDLKPVATLKNNATNEEKQNYINDVAKDNATLMNIMGTINTPALKVKTNIEVLADDNKNIDNVIKQTQDLNKEYRDYLAGEAKIYQKGQELSSSRSSMVILTTLVLDLLLKTVYEAATTQVK